MNAAISTATFLNGLLLGWSVAWPPGPINTEIFRRSVTPAREGGGVWAGWQIGLGACIGDFIWALAVMTGAGAVLDSPRIRGLLGIVSLILLLFLAATFARGAWRAAHSDSGMLPNDRKPNRKQRGYLLGFVIALTSPWNLGFWLAVIGGQQSISQNHSFSTSIAFALFVVLGALIWMTIFSAAVRQGARIFARPSWQVATQAITSLLMLFFAERLLVRLIS